MSSVLLAGAIIGTILLPSPYPTPLGKASHFATNALTIVDWAQTRYIAKHPGRYYETNPLLGRHPSVSRVDNYFAACWVADQIIVWVLPLIWSRLYLTSRFMVGYNAVTNNAEIGIKVDF